MAHPITKATAWYLTGFLEVANMAVSRIRSNIGQAPAEVRTGLQAITEHLDTVGTWIRKIANE